MNRGHFTAIGGRGMEIGKRLDALRGVVGRLSEELVRRFFAAQRLFHGDSAERLRTQSGYTDADILDPSFPSMSRTATPTIANPEARWCNFS